MAVAEGDIYDGLVTAFRRSLTAARKSPKTIRGYVSTVLAFARYGAEHDFPDDVAKVERRHVEDFIVHVLDEATPSTAATYFAHLQAWFKWLILTEGELDRSPMEGMARPKITDATVPTVAIDDLRALLGACGSRGFADRRDAAMIRVLLDTGMRVGELVGMTAADIDLDGGRIRVLGKGDKARWVGFGLNTGTALDRYGRERRKHPKATVDAYWLGVRGPMTTSGVAQMLRRRCDQAGIGHINPHQFRHTFSHNFMASGGNESDLMVLTGWTSAEMVRRYGRSAAAQRAIDAQHRLSLGDSL